MKSKMMQTIRSIDMSLYAKELLVTLTTLAILPLHALSESGDDLYRPAGKGIEIENGIGANGQAKETNEPHVPYRVGVSHAPQPVLSGRTARPMRYTPE